MKILLLLMFLFVATLAAAAAPVAGNWDALIKVRDIELRLALHVTESGNSLQATLDSIDQKVMGMPVDKIEVKGQQVQFEITVIGATYTGTLNKTGTAITGAWSQLGMSYPLNFQKAAQAKK